MTFQVGDKVSYNDFCDRRDSQIPAGSVILFPSGNAHVLNPAGSAFIFKTGVITELMNLTGPEKHFTLIHVPDTDASERDELAFQVYKLMNPDTAHTGAKDFGNRTVADFWPFQVADYVLSNFKRKVSHPDLIDSDGDRWVWSDAEEAYRCPGLPHMEPKTEEYIREWYGPIHEAA